MRCSLATPNPQNLKKNFINIYSDEHTHAHKSPSKFKLLPSFNLTAKIKVNQKDFVVPITGGVGFDNLFLSEPWMTRLLVKLKPFFTGRSLMWG
jgi:hypothetical protein